MCNTETLLLIDDQKSQILWFDVLRKDAVRSDDNVDQALLQTVHRSSLFRRCAESRKQFDTNREIFHSRYKSLIMLLGQNGRRHQEKHLIAVHNGLKCGTDCNLRFAVTDIPADQALHDLIAFHVRLGGFDCCQLIVGFLIGKHLFKLFLPDGIPAESMAHTALSGCIQFHQIPRNPEHSLMNLRLGLMPLLCSEFVKFRRFALLGGIFHNGIEGTCKHIQIRIAGIFHLHVILGNTVI